MHLFPERVKLQGLESELFKIVSYGASPEQWAKWLRTPLEHAAARGNLRLVDMLLEAGAYGRAGWRGTRGRSLLEAAAVGGNPDVLSSLIRAGAKWDAKVVSISSRRSALYTATVCGHDLAARQLILAGANVNFQDPMDRCDVLSNAVKGGHEQLTKDLLQSGADLTSRDLLGRTPLHHAAILGHGRIVSVLLLSGADKDVRDYKRDSPLTLAAGRGHVAAVEVLLAAGATAKARGFYGYNALDLGAREGHVPIMNLCLQHGADVEDRDIMGCTALHAAAICNQGSAVHVLVDAGADIELKSKNGMNSLQHASENNCCEAMLALLQRGANVNTRDVDFGFTPLHQTCSMHGTGVQAAVKLLLRWGADENALDNDGYTPAELLDFCRGDGLECSREELERVRCLLTMAPVERNWRRRSWLVMYRSRVDKAKSMAWLSDCDTDMALANVCGVGSQKTSAAGDKWVKKSDWPANRGAESGFGAANGSTADEEGEGWSSAIEKLVGLELEGVFRTVLGYL